MSPSRRDALDRIRHFEQLASSQTFSGNIPDEALGMLLMLMIKKQSSIDFADCLRERWQHFQFIKFKTDAEMQAEQGVSSGCPFEVNDVDYVTSISFNYGLSLMDMNQVFRRISTVEYNQLKLS